MLKTKRIKRLLGGALIATPVLALGGSFLLMVYKTGGFSDLLTVLGFMGASIAIGMVVAGCIIAGANLLVE